MNNFKCAYIPLLLSNVSINKDMQLAVREAVSEADHFVMITTELRPSCLYPLEKSV